MTSKEVRDRCAKNDGGPHDPNQEMIYVKGPASPDGAYHLVTRCKKCRWFFIPGKGWLKNFPGANRHWTGRRFGK